jgi:hypothetical protein
VGRRSTRVHPSVTCVCKLHRAGENPPDSPFPPGRPRRLRCLAAEPLANEYSCSLYAAFAHDRWLHGTVSLRPFTPTAVPRLTFITGHVRFALFGRGYYLILASRYRTASLEILANSIGELASSASMVIHFQTSQNPGRYGESFQPVCPSSVDSRTADPQVLCAGEISLQFGHNLFKAQHSGCGEHQDYSQPVGPQRSEHAEKADPQVLCAASDCR